MSKPDIIVRGEVVAEWLALRTEAEREQYTWRMSLEQYAALATLKPWWPRAGSLREVFRQALDLAAKGELPEA